MEPNAVDPKIIDAANQRQAAALSPQAILDSSSGKAYQSMAQSAAIAVQDAADHLRNISTLATTAIGVAMAQYLATGDEKHVQAINKAQELMKTAADNFSAIGSTAATMLKDMPAG